MPRGTAHHISAPGTNQRGTSAPKTFRARPDPRAPWRSANAPKRRGSPLAEALSETAQIAHAGVEDVGHHAREQQVTAMTGTRDQSAHGGNARPHQTPVVVQALVAHRVELIHRNHMRGQT